MSRGNGTTTISMHGQSQKVPLGLLLCAKLQVGFLYDYQVGVFDCAWTVRDPIACLVIQATSRLRRRVMQALEILGEKFLRRPARKPTFGWGNTDDQYVIKTANFYLRASDIPHYIFCDNRAVVSGGRLLDLVAALQSNTGEPNGK